MRVYGPGSINSRWRRKNQIRWRLSRFFSFVGFIIEPESKPGSHRCRLRAPCVWPSARCVAIRLKRLRFVVAGKILSASDHGEYRRHSPLRSTGCCLPAGQNRRHSPTKTFGAQHLQGRHHPLPLHLACFRAYASTRPLPATPQGSILGSRLTITQAGDFHPLEHAALPGRTVPVFSPVFSVFPRLFHRQPTGPKVNHLMTRPSEAKPR